jgi:exonuclease III
MGRVDTIGGDDEEEIKNLLTELSEAQKELAVLGDMKKLPEEYDEFAGEIIESEEQKAAYEKRKRAEMIRGLKVRANIAKIKKQLTELGWQEPSEGGKKARTLKNRKSRKGTRKRVKK